MPLPSEEATELVDVEVAEDAPKAVARGELGAERARVPEEETNVRELGLEPREEGWERVLVAREVLVALALIVVQIAHLAEFVVSLLLLRLLLLIVVVIFIIIFRGIGFRVRIRAWFLSLCFFLHYRTEDTACLRRKMGNSKKLKKNFEEEEDSGSLRGLFTNRVQKIPMEAW
jgi:hypothetical protein